MHYENNGLGHGFTLGSSLFTISHIGVFRASFLMISNAALMNLDYFFCICILHCLAYEKWENEKEKKPLWITNDRKT